MDDIASLHSRLRSLVLDRDWKSTVLLAQEGIKLFITGPEHGGGRPGMNRGFIAPTSRGFLALLVGAAAIACAPILMRLADVSPAASAFWRVALAAPALWLWTLAPAKAASWRGNKAVLLAGLLFACDLGAWHLSVAWTSVANATLESNFAPLFVTLGAWLLWRQHASRMFVLALAISFAGAVLLIGPNLGAGRTALAGDALGVLTAVFYAGYMLALKTATGALSTPMLMAVSTSVSALLLLPYAWLTAEQFLPEDTGGWMILAALAALPQVIGQSLIAYGFSRLSAPLSSLILLLQPVLAAWFAWLLLGEGMTTVQLAGGVLVLTGIYLARPAG